jgi:hypothetical protein
MKIFNPSSNFYSQVGFQKNYNHIIKPPQNQTVPNDMSNADQFSQEKA